MSYHGIELIGIAIALAGLGTGSLAFFGLQGTVYAPNGALTAAGTLVTIVGAVVDPLIDRRLGRTTAK